MSGGREAGRGYRLESDRVALALQEVKDVNIGEPQRIIEIEPVVLPVPEVMPDPIVAPAPEPVSTPLEPVGTVIGG